MRPREDPKRLQETPPPRWLRQLLRSSTGQREEEPEVQKPAQRAAETPPPVAARHLALGADSTVRRPEDGEGRSKAVGSDHAASPRGKAEGFEAILADQWLDGTVHHATPFGVFVDAYGPGSTKPMRGLVYVTEMDRYPFDPERAFPPGRQVRVRIIDVDAAAEGTLLLSMRTGPLELRADLLARGQAPEIYGPAEVDVGVRVRNPVHQRTGLVVHAPWGEPPIFLVRFDDGSVHARWVSKFVAEDGRPLAVRKYPATTTGGAGACWKCQRRSPLDEKAKNGKRYCYECWYFFLYD